MSHATRFMNRIRTIVACLFCLTLVGGAVGPAAAQPDLQPKETVKAAFALLESIDDQGWTTAHYEGIQHMQEVLGDAVEVAYTEHVVNPADAERVIRDYAAQDFDIVFATTFAHMDPTMTVAEEFPDTVFEHCSGYKQAPNMGNYFARMYQAEYLAGYMAGLMGFKNVGTVATQPIPEPVRGINAFTIGLKKGLTEAGHEFDPEAVVTVAWLKAWRDPINETTLAETMAARGHDLIRQMADTPDSAKAACAAGVPAIGYGVDAARYGADCALLSTVWNWGPIYVNKVSAVKDATWTSESYWGGFDEGVIAISDFHGDVPAAVVEKVNAEKARLEAGDDDIFAGPVANQAGDILIQEGAQASDQDLLTMRWLVHGVSGSIPE